MKRRCILILMNTITEIIQTPNITNSDLQNKKDEIEKRYKEYIRELEEEINQLGCKGDYEV